MAYLHNRHAVYKLDTTYGCEALIKLRYPGFVQSLAGTPSQRAFSNHKFAPIRVNSRLASPFNLLGQAQGAGIELQ